jgi:integrase
VLLADLSSYHIQVLRAKRRAALTLAKYEAAERLYCAYVAEPAGRTPVHTDLNLTTARAFLVWLESEHVATAKHGARGHGPQNLVFYHAVLKAWSKVVTQEWEDAHGVCLFPKGDPLARLQRPKVPQTVIELLPQARVELVLKVAGSTRQPRRNQAILAFLRYTGVRVTELCGVRLDDVELGSSRKAGRALVRGKGDKERYVYWGGECGKYLARYLGGERNGSASPYLFVSQRGGGRLSRDAVEEMLRTVGAQAGVRGLHPHQLRHTFATRYLQKHPGRLEQLRRLMGHATLDMTLRYAKLAESDLEGSVEDWDD